MKNCQKIRDFYIAEDENPLLEHILPWHYVELNIDKKIDVDYALRFLQNEMNAALHSFTNGGFSNAGFALYPIIKDVSQTNIERITRIKRILDLLNENGYDFSASLNECKYGVTAGNFASILSSLYLDFSSIKNNKTKQTKKPKCRELDFSEYKKGDKDYLMPLKELKHYAEKNLRQYLAGFYLHGSFATRDYIKGWSDIDTLCIISRDTIAEPKKLLRLREKMYMMRSFLCRIDPLQHHGSIAISEYDVKSYCQSYFPVPIFKYSKSFFDLDMISGFNIRESSSEALVKMFWFVNYFRRLKFEKQSFGSYEIKNLLHSIMLFPSVYLQANGIFVYKKFSFGIAKRSFSRERWKVIDEASSIRERWKSYGSLPFVALFSKINPVLCYQLNSRIIDLFKDASRINNINIGKIIDGIYQLSEYAWSKVKKNVKNRKL